MRIDRPLAACLILVVGMAALSLWAAPHIAEAPVAVHFGADGRPNGYSSPAVALAFGPLLGLGLAVGLSVLAAAMPASGRLERSATAWGAARVGTVLLVALVHAVLLAHAIDAALDPLRPITLGVGVLVAVLGNFLPKTRYNYVMGIRTPWTLASERVWDRTHRLAGPLTVAGGLALIVASLAAPTASLTACMMACVLTPTALAVFWSWRIAREEGAA